MTDPEQTLTMGQYLALPEAERMAVRVRSLEAVLQTAAQPARRYNLHVTAGPRAAPTVTGLDDPSEAAVQEAAEKAHVTEEQAWAVVRHVFHRE